jgi:hypothetical protein
VYLVSGDLFDAFEKPIESLVAYDDLPTCKPDALMSLTLEQGDRTVVLRRSIPGADSAPQDEAFWERTVNGGDTVRIADDLADSLDLLLGDMDYLVCYSVSRDSFAEYGLAENTVAMTVVYTKYAEGAETEETFTLTLGSADKYGYYYANPKDTTLTMLLGGSVFNKTMTYDDVRIAEGDAPAETDTAN